MLVTTEESPVPASGPATVKRIKESADSTNGLLKALKLEQSSWLRLAALCSLTGVLGIVGLYGGVSLILSSAAVQDGFTPPYWAWLLIALGIVLRLAANIGRDWAGQKLSAHARLALRMRLLQHATHHGPAYLQTLGHTGWWVQRHAEQVDALHGYLARHLPARQTAIMVPTVIVLMVIWLDWVAGMLLLLALPLIPLFMALIGMGTQTVQEAQQDQQARLSAELLQRMESLPLLRRLNALTSSAKVVGEAADGYRALAMRVLRVAFLSSATLELFSALAIGLVAIYIGFALLGMVTFGPAAELTLFHGLFILMLAPECFLPLRQLALTHHDLSGARAAAETLAPLLKSVRAYEHADTALTKETSTSQNLPLSPDSDFKKSCRTGYAQAINTLVFQAVDFTYPGDAQTATPPLIKDLSFTLQAGEVVGVSGPSGSGKSTVMALAAGFLQPSSGRIQRAAQWAWLPQRVHLFHGTLRQNLQMACAAPAADAALLEALSQAGLQLPHPDLPLGLETLIGDQSSGLSGGQAQRVGVARALLCGAPLWLLDEPTAALDAPTRDRLLSTTLAAARQSSASILVASHDPVVLAQCHRVLYLSSSEVAG